MDSTTRRTTLQAALRFVMNASALIVATHLSASGAEPTRAVEARPQLGINLTSAVDYSSEQPLVDIFHLSRKWISQRQGSGFGKGPQLELDPQGWIKRLEPGCWAETTMCTLKRGNHYPGGTYTVLYDGEGTLKVIGAASIRSQRPGQMSLDVDPTKGRISLQLWATRPDNPIRNIRVLMPGVTEQSARENPWRPDFLDRWRGMACIRFMDLMATNNSKIATWADRPKLDDATYTTKGVPIELLIDLANRLDIPPWFCIPHQADDDYVRNFATLVKEQVKPELKIYIEYSNEVWNGMFQQHRFAGAQGQKLGLAKEPWEAAWRYTAYRSVEIFKIFEEVFGGTDRLVRVFASQAANSRVAQEILGFRDAAKYADALAIAPYCSFNVSPKNKPGVTEVANWSADQVFDHLEKVSLPKCEGWMRDNQKVAQQFGVTLVAYEAGQHLTGALGGENNDALTKLLTSANRDPRMGGVYDRYYEAWQRAGGGLLCHFSSVSPSNKWGSWGLLEYTDDDPALAPKYTATIKWGQSLGQPVTIQKPPAPFTKTSRSEQSTRSDRSTSRSSQPTQRRPPPPPPIRRGRSNQR